MTLCDRLRNRSQRQSKSERAKINIRSHPAILSKDRTFHIGMSGSTRA